MIRPSSVAHSLMLEAEEQGRNTIQDASMVSRVLIHCIDFMPALGQVLIHISATCETPKEDTTVIMILCVTEERKT